MDWVYLSNTGLNTSPPSADFQTPPLADPTYKVRRSAWTASMAAMRPLMAAGPIERASRPPNVSESTFASCAASGGARATASSAAQVARRVGRFIASVLLRRRGLGGFGHLEARIVERGVQLHLLESDVLLLRTALCAVLDRVRD